MKINKMSSLLVHIGYPKTATTTIQENIIYKLSKLNKINYLCHSEKIIKKNKLKNAILIRKIYEYIIYKKWDNEILNEINNIKKEKSLKYIISAETLSVLSENNERNRMLLSSSIHNNANRIKRIFSKVFNNIKIIIVIRSQNDFCYSIYKEWYPYLKKTSNINNFDDFTKEYTKKSNIKNGYLNYYKIILNYKKIFGNKNVDVLFYEDLIYNKNFFGKKLAKIFKINNKFTHKSLYMKLNFKNDYEYNVSLNFIITKYISSFVKLFIGKKKFEILKNIYIKYLFDLIEFFHVKQKFKNEKYNKSLYYNSEFKKINLNLTKLKLSRAKLKKYNYI